MWWLDVVVLAAAVTAWFLVPRWVAMTSGFYRRIGWNHFAPNARGESVIAIAFRAALGLVGLFAISDLIVSLVRSL
jgi:hypothetical protein